MFENIVKKSKGNKEYKIVMIDGHGFCVDSKKVREWHKDYTQYDLIKRLNNKTIKLKKVDVLYEYV